MPSLQQLKAKWFIDVTLNGQFPPHTRHPGTQLQPYTDGNLNRTRTGGTPYGASAFAPDSGGKSLSEEEQALARLLGYRVAECARRLGDPL